MAGRLQSFLFDQEQIADFAQRLDTVSAIKDSAERLLSYHVLKQEVQSCDFSKMRSAKQLAAMTVSSPLVMAASLGSALLGLPIYVGAGVFLVGASMLTAGFVTMHKGAEFNPMRTLLPRVNAAIEAEIQTARLEDMRQSPQFNAALDAFPALEERFSKVAARALLLEAPTPPAQTPLRLTLDKPVHSVLALPAPQPVNPKTT